MGRVCDGRSRLGPIRLLWFLQSVCEGAVTVSRLGEDAVLRCHFERATARGLIIEWTVHDPVRVAYSFHGGRAREGSQDRQFRGRATVEASGLSRGEASLRLRETRVEDEGRYVCFVRTSRGKNETRAVLELVAPYSEPRVSCSEAGPRSEDPRVNLSCRSDGGFPRSEAGWRWANGSRLAGESWWSQEGDGTYGLRSWVTVEGGLRSAEPRCVVRNRRTNRTQLSREFSCEGDVGGRTSACAHLCRGKGGYSPEPRARPGIAATPPLVALCVLLLLLLLRRAGACGRGTGPPATAPALERPL